MSTSTAEQLGERYAKFTEESDWEGETWHFYIPVAGNEEALKVLAEKVESWGPNSDYELDNEYLTEDEVDTLVEHGDDDGYMPEHNKLSGRLDVDRVREHEDLYKGGIKDCMVADGAGGS